MCYLQLNNKKFDKILFIYKIMFYIYRKGMYNACIVVGQEDISELETGIIVV